MSSSSRLGLRASDAAVLVHGPSAHTTMPSAKSSGSHSPKGEDGEFGSKKSIGKSFTTFIKGLFATNGKSSKEGAGEQQSRDGPVKAKSFSSAVSPLSPLSPQGSGASSNAEEQHPTTAAHIIAAQHTAAKSSSFSVGMANKGHMASLRQELLNANASAHSPPGAKIVRNSSKAGDFDVAGMVSRQPSRTFLELRAQAQVIPTKGNQLLAVCPNLPAKMSRPTWTMKDYAIVEKMYKGYASTVYKAFCKRSGELVCLKAYDMANLCELNRFQIYREVQLHSRLQHPNVITLYGAFQQDNQVVLVQEFADGGDLFTLLHRYGGRLPERQAVEMVLQPFLTVLNYLHQQGILHRDLKPENILFTRTLGLKLCDFGLAIDLRDERAVTRAGTLEYMAPEVLKCPFKNKPEENKEANRYYYDISVDAWAVGVLIYELLVGFPPFNDKNRPAVEEKIRTEQPRFPSGMSEPARSFVSWVLQKDPLERPTIMDMLHHPFVQGQRKVAPQPAAAPAPSAMAPSQQKLKAKGPIPALMEDDLDTALIRPKNAMQSFTAGKAPQISNKAMQPSSRHMELPHLPQSLLNNRNSNNNSNVNGNSAEPATPLSPNSALKDSSALAAKKLSPALSKLEISRTASVPQMVHVRPPNLSPTGGM